MSDNKWGATFSGGEEPTPPHGMEIDLRPNPAGLPLGATNAGDSTQVLRRPVLRHDGGASGSPDWGGGHTTGAFVSQAASSRHEVAPYRWWQVGWGVGLVLFFCVVVPAALLAWSIYKIISDTHGG